MRKTKSMLGALACAALVMSAHADELRNVKQGEPVPAYKLPGIDGGQVDSDTMRGSVVVLVYLSGEQRSSELAATESHEVIGALERDDVKLVYASADVVHKSYFQRFRSEHGLGKVPMALDGARDLYAKLGLIVFPTTVVADKDGNLAHVISTRGPDYPHVLDAYVRHALGMIDDAQLADALKARVSGVGSPKSLASRHRSAARLLRDKGLLPAAREELLKARELDPDDFDIRLDLADLDLSMGNVQDALTLVDKMLVEQPEHRRAKQLKGIALYRLDRLDEAEAMLNEAIELNPEPARAQYYLGRICERTGRTQEALEHYREALSHVLDEPEG